MTREEAIKKHRELWHWIADEHRRRKSVSVQNFENPEVAEKAPKNDCWLCEYVKQLEKDSPGSGWSGCDCPIKWGENNEYCVSIGSPYIEWNNRYGKNYEDLAKLADIIAELPEKGKE